MPRRLASNRPPEPFFGDYTSRVLLSMAAVLSATMMVAHIPGSEAIEYTPWGQGIWSEHRGGTITAHDVLTLYPNAQVIPAEGAGGEEIVRAEQESDANAKPRGDVNLVDPDPEPAPERRTFRSVATLGPDAHKPRIIGGMQQLYLNVKYPKEARKQRIQGRVIVNFVVHETGRVSDIQVLRALHPLCDSSVVQAVRNTIFVPAEENGERVAVRMALPVRFQLIDAPGLQDFETRPADNATAGTATAQAASTKPDGVKPNGVDVP